MKKHLLLTLLITMFLSMALATVALAEKPPGKHCITAIVLSADSIDKTTIIAVNNPVDYCNLVTIYVAQIPFSSTFGPPNNKHTAVSTSYFPHEHQDTGHIVASTKAHHRIRGTPV